MRGTLGRLCVLVFVGLSVFCIKAQTQQSWPTFKDLSMSGRDWKQLSELGISSHDFDEVKRITSDWLNSHCGHDRSAKKRDKHLAALTSKHIELSRTSRAQLAVREEGDWEGDSGSCSCGPNLNCHTWLLEFGKSQATALLEFNGFGPIVLDASSHGYSDLVTASNSQSRSFDFVYWRFNGRRYERVRCASQHYSLSENTGEPLIGNSTPEEHPCRR